MWTQEAGLNIDAVEVAGEASEVYLSEESLPNVLEWLTDAVAGLESDDWAPWDRDERCFSVKWTRGPRGAWRRWV